MANSTNFDELKYVWKNWRDATGRKMKDLYKVYVDLSNEAARANSKFFNNSIESQFNIRNNINCTHEFLNNILYFEVK